MCAHEGRDCPGRSCSCECMNCMFPDENIIKIFALVDEGYGYDEAVATLIDMGEIDE